LGTGESAEGRGFLFCRGIENHKMRENESIILTGIRKSPWTQQGGIETGKDPNKIDTTASRFQSCLSKRVGHVKKGLATAGRRFLNNNLIEGSLKRDLERKIATKE